MQQQPRYQLTPSVWEEDGGSWGTRTIPHCSCSSLRIVPIQFLSCLVQLPPILSTTDIVWLSCFCYPLLR